ncbi:hypothetical protein CS0771_37500 [Catellatospora sp. IY07-71]|uniref:hypothetical protein n=1 Tax=Catellatospora sp. IY07-71 TaxID=2728827 RepID=UPI001BB44181|nr:hypothetical protein [Catellatospora sp. IY07-71]BCJ74206.1 hypothetical protein CS0771_37500 [Catellatospora sp. IY07-71]
MDRVDAARAGEQSSGEVVTAVAQKSGEPKQDVVKAYLELALGLTEASKKKAEKTVKKAAKGLLGKSGATATQLQVMAEELVSTGLQNREAVARIVRLELDRALGRVGLATAEEVATLTARIEDLEGELREARIDAAVAAARAASADGSGSADGSATAAAPSAEAAEEDNASPVAKKAVAGKVTPPAVRVPPRGGVAERPEVVERPRELPKPAAKKAEAAKPAPKPAPPKKAAKVVAKKTVPAAGPRAASDEVPVAAKKAVAKKAVKKAPAGKAATA